MPQNIKFLLLSYFGYGGHSTRQKILTSANYIFPAFISHKRVRISKLNRKRYFKTRFESSLSHCKFILNSSLNILATFQLLWDTFIEITHAPVSVRQFPSKWTTVTGKQVESTDVYRWRRRNFVHFDRILPEIQTFCIGTAETQRREGSFYTHDGTF